MRTWIADNPKCWGGKPKPLELYPWHEVTLTYDDISDLQEILDHLNKDETRYR